MAPRKNNNPVKKEEKTTTKTSASNTKQKETSTPNKLFKPIVFKPARSAASANSKKKKKDKCTSHDILFYPLQMHEDTHGVAIIVCGEGDVRRGSWMQKVLDDMVRRGDDLFPVPFFDGTFFLCDSDNNKIMSTDG